MELGDLYIIKDENVLCLGYLKNKIYVNMNVKKYHGFYYVELKSEKGLFFLFNNNVEAKKIGKGLLIEIWS